MKSWTKDIEIKAPIEQVWNLLNGNLAEMQKIMPQVIAHEPLKLTTEKIGSVYLQKYREGNRVQEYEIVTLDYVNENNYKRLKVGFTLANMFEITAQYELKEIGFDTTYFNYSTTNKPLKWFLKPLVMLGSNKVVIQFVEQVKKVAEAEAQKIKNRG
ncbi:SRPBCC family protein [Ureibacillus aquaedulcis]|uniref:SRPBCC family protein n=1 Tax=Ureibacillus aquaedulcis TaxID=3058421 RepID=A0ABT8GPZ5_9BACL|nr:SRPBCC family protein [Ureibacillus sp. BA0131]MDN4493472.1 SRPBCC family protein [Ureibacillus sp. BA0131]